MWKYTENSIVFSLKEFCLQELICLYKFKNKKDFLKIIFIKNKTIEVSFTFFLFNSEGILGSMGQTTNRTTPTLNYVRCHPILHKDYYRLNTCFMRCRHSMCKQNSHIMLAVTVHDFQSDIGLKRK